jgi:dienelactone hydrolase
MSRPYLVVLSCCLVVLTQRVAPADTSSVWEYLGERAVRLAERLPELPESVEAWEERRAEWTARLERELGLPQREPMRAAVLESRVEGNLLFEDIAFHWAEDVYASGTVIRLSQTDGPQPAVVIAPDWLGHHSFSAYRSLVRQLASEGVLVLFVDDPRTGRRQGPYAGLYATASAAGMQAFGIQVFDTLRALDYLRTRADVDTAKIGIAGLGEGALRAYVGCALEGQFQFIVAVAGTTTYASLVQAVAADRAVADPSAFVSGILTWTDLDRLAACAAPRPVLIADGAGRWPPSGSDAVLDTLRTVYGLYGAEDRILVVRRRTDDDMARTIVQRLKTSILPALNAPSAPPASCDEPGELDFRVLGYLQRRIEGRAASWLDQPLTSATWSAHRQTLVDWLHPVVAGDADPRWTTRCWRSWKRAA